MSYINLFIDLIFFLQNKIRDTSVPINKQLCRHQLLLKYSSDMIQLFFLLLRSNQQLCTMNAFHKLKVELIKAYSRLSKTAVPVGNCSPTIKKKKKRESEKGKKRNTHAKEKKKSTEEGTHALEGKRICTQK